MVAIEKTFRGFLVDHLGQLPSQIHRILHAGVESLSADRVVHVRGVAGQQDSSVPVCLGLPGHVGEPGDPGGAVDSVIGPARGDESFAEVTQGGFARGPDVIFRHHDPYWPAIQVDHFAVADLILPPAEGIDSNSAAVDAQFRLLGHLDLGNQAARRRIPTGKADAGRLADQTAASVAPNEILRPQPLAV